MNTLIKRVEQAGAAVAGMCIVAIMIVISADAFARYAFRQPLQWTADVVSTYLMVAAVYFALSETFRRGDHISINLIQSRMSPRVRAVTGIVYSVPAAVVFATIAYGSMESTIHAFTAGEYIPGYLPWPLWLSHLPVALGSGLLAIRLLHHAMTLLVRGEDPAVSLDGGHIE